MAAEDFDTWYREHHPRLIRALVVLTGDADEAREIVDVREGETIDLEVTCPIR